MHEPTFEYDGTAKRPKVTAYLGNITLVEGRDYTIEYKNNVNAGHYDDDGPCVVLTGKGSYSGTLTAQFEIKPMSLDKVDMIPSIIPVVAAETDILIPDRLPFKLVYKGKDLTCFGYWDWSGDFDVRALTGDGRISHSFENDCHTLVDLAEGYHELELHGHGNFTGELKVPFMVAAAGILKTGWQDVDGVGKVYNVGGSLVRGWKDIDGGKYWFHENGSMATGWTDVVVDGKVMHYYFNPASGNLVRDTWFTISGVNYYFRPSGNLATGWVSIKDDGVDKKYYFREDGSLVKGTWYDMKNDSGVTNHYYFRPSGAMQTGEAAIDGKACTFTGKGVLVS